MAKKTVHISDSLTSSNPFSTRYWPRNVPSVLAHLDIPELLSTTAVSRINIPAKFTTLFKSTLIVLIIFFNKPIISGCGLFPMIFSKLCHLSSTLSLIKAFGDIKEGLSSHFCVVTHINNALKYSSVNRL